MTIKDEDTAVREPFSFGLSRQISVDAPAPATSPERSSAGHLLLLMDVSRELRRPLLMLLACGLVISIAVAFLIPKRYEAVTRLMPPDQSTGMTARMLGALTARAGDTVGGLASDLLGTQTQSATLVGILGSRTVQDALINRFDLRAAYSKKKYDAARKVLTHRTDILEDRKSGIITIRVEDSSPVRAAAIARGYVDELNSRVSQLTTSGAHRERVFLEGRLQAIKRQLDDATLQLSRFSSKSRTFDPQVEGKAMIEAASTLQGQTIAAESELRGLEQIYGPENSKVRAASAKVAELRSKLRQLSGNNAISDAEPLTNDELYPSIEQLPLLGNTYYDLARRVKINEAVYEALTKQYELAKVDEAKEIPSIKVLDEPVVPESKSWPPRIFVIVLGVLFTIAVACLWILAEAGYDRLSPADPRRLLADRLFRPVFRRSSLFLQRPRLTNEP